MKQEKKISLGEKEPEKEQKKEENITFKRKMSDNIFVILYGNDKNRTIKQETICLDKGTITEILFSEKGEVIKMTTRQEAPEILAKKFTKGEILMRKLDDGVIIKIFGDDKDRPVKQETTFPDGLIVETLFDEKEEIVKFIQRGKTPQGLIQEIHFDKNKNPIETYLKDESGHVFKYVDLKEAGSQEERILELKAMGIKNPEKIIGFLDLKPKSKKK
jgi:hypothetical protein